MDLQKEFQQFIKEKKLFSPKEKILLAVSGGVDSVVMAELFHRCGYRFGIAHCNFQLRGEDSDKDEEFVKKLAAKYKVEFYSRRFNTKAYSKEKKLSAQEAARDLRYAWFIFISQNEKYSKISTAHHCNDSIETFFINLLRGTGLAGLKGITHYNSSINTIRPLLFSLREDIKTYAQNEKISFRHDASNDTDDYLRNRIRHHLAPLLKELNPSFEKVMARNMHAIEFAEHIFSTRIVAELMRMRHLDGSQVYFDRKEFQETKYPAELLSEFIKPLGFSDAQIADIWNAKKSGSLFFSGNIAITIDRDRILLNEVLPEDDKELLLTMLPANHLHGNFTLRTHILSEKDVPVISKNKIQAPSTLQCFDLDKLKFPLIARKWKPGDFFYPLGMTHKKKISDFLIDNKVSRPEKERVYVLSSGNDIVSLLGLRIDNRYKVTAKTKQVYCVEYFKKL